MKIKPLLFCGILAPVVYVGAVVLGGVLRPGYSHVQSLISDLIGSGAPNKWMLDPLFGLYNLFCLAFGLGAFMSARAAMGNPRRIVGLTGSTILVLEGLVGFLTLFFPEDPAGAPMTSVGMTHIVLAGLSSLATMASMLLLGLWFRGDPSRKGLSTYSFVSVGFVFLTGGFTAAMGATHSALSGLMERLTIGGFLQWLLVTAIVLPAAPRAEAAV